VTCCDMVNGAFMLPISKPSSSKEIGSRTHTETQNLVQGVNFSFRNRKKYDNLFEKRVER
jgi:hypothetical protein